jgi:UDP-glucose 4-epimerase
MRAIVTGGAGFIGSHVAERLARDGHHVLVIDDLSGGSRDNVPQGVRFEKLSVNDSLDPVFSDFRPETVYHLAAYAAEGLSHHVPVFNYANNLLGTANVLAAAHRAGVAYFVFTSSIAVYGYSKGGEPFTEDTPGRPADPYGIAKLACEQHIAAFERYFGGPSFTILRPHNVFGPRQNISDPYRNVVGIFMAAALRRQPMPVFGDGSQTRSFSYVDVVAEAITQAPFVPAARNLSVNIGGDEPMSVRQLASSVARVLGVEDRVEFLPPRQEVQHAHCDHALARRIFADAYASNAIDIRVGLERMAEHVRTRAIPAPTEFPGVIELPERLPPSWASRLNDRT